MEFSQLHYPINYSSKFTLSGAVKTVKRLSLTKPIIVMLPARATSIPEDAGAAFEMIMGIPTRITFISMSAGILPLYET